MGCQNNITDLLTNMPEFILILMMLSVSKLIWNFYFRISEIRTPSFAPSDSKYLAPIMCKYPFTLHLMPVCLYSL